MTDDSHKRRGKRKKKHRRKKKRGGHDDSDDTMPLRTNSHERVTRSSSRRAHHHHYKHNNNNNNNKRRSESISLISDVDGQQQQQQHDESHGQSFEDIKREAQRNGNNEQIGSDFRNDTLITDIANKMLEIRQSKINKLMDTPEVTAQIRQGLNVLVAAMEEMDNNKYENYNNNNGKNNGKNNGGKTLKIRIRRQGKEMYVVDNKKENSLSNCGIQKIKDILKTKYNNFFKLNDNAIFLKDTNGLNDNGDLEKKLKLLLQQFTNHYDKGLLQVFKTCSIQSFKQKFESINKLTTNNKVIEYFKIWDEIIKQHIISDMEMYLNKKNKIKEVLGLMFAVMDHIFSYSMYQYLCNLNINHNNKQKNNKDDDNNNNNNNNDDEKEAKMKQEDDKTEKQVKSEQFVKTRGNLLFSEIESKKDELKWVEEKHLCWLFEYWKKILLQSQDPVKRLCRSYLVNCPPNPYKNKLYLMITQITYSPFTSVLPTKKSSTSNLTHSVKNEPNIQQQIAKKEQSKTNNDDNNSNKNRKKSPKAPLIINIKNKSQTPPNTNNSNNNIMIKRNNNHFVRNSISSMSLNGINKNNPSSNNNNLMTMNSSVCGKNFTSSTECGQHQKSCKDCDHRIVSSKSM